MATQLFQNPAAPTRVNNGTPTKDDLSMGGFVVATKQKENRVIIVNAEKHIRINRFERRTFI
jgi:hypothetical protein